MGIVDEEQAAAREELITAMRLRAESEAAIRAAVKRARDAKLPITEIAAIAEVSRETVYRWIDRPVR